MAYSLFLAFSYAATQPFSLLKPLFWFGAAARAGSKSHNTEIAGAGQPHNKALHPTAYAPVVPPFATVAGELGRCAACARRFCLQ
jgi:hypothetical protein